MRTFSEYDLARNGGLEEAAVILDNFCSLIVQEAILSSSDLVAATNFQKKVMPISAMIRERKRD